MKYGFRSLIASLFVLHASTAFADAPCDTFTRQMTKRVVDLFHDKTQSDVQKRQTLSKLFDEAVDTDWIGKFALGHYWSSATPAEQADFLKLYRAYINKRYTSKFSDEDVAHVDDITLTSITPQEKQQFLAKTRIVQKGDEDVIVDYLLAQNGSSCKVHDITIEGVSLITSQRAEFGSLAASAGVKGVNDAMKKQLGQ